MYADQESRSRQQAGSRARIHALIRSPLLCGRIRRAVRRPRPPSSPTPHSFPASPSSLPCFSPCIPKTTFPCPPKPPLVP